MSRILFISFNFSFMSLNVFLLYYSSKSNETSIKVLTDCLFKAYRYYDDFVFGYLQKPASNTHFHP